MVLYEAIYFAVSVLWLLFFRLGAVKTPFKPLAYAFFLGLLAGPVAGVISMLIKSAVMPAGTTLYDTSVAAFFGSVLITGPVEEMAKFTALFIAVNRNMNITKPVQVMLAGLSAALGFAGGENVLYMRAYGLETTLPRLILGNLGHAGYAALWSYAYGVVLLQGARFSLLWVALSAAAFVHGVYNYMLGFSLPGAIISFSITALSGALALKLLTGLRE